ncbi:hypothetical protein [Cylindrospermum sp. FACHB-282]|uniref:hypothetical protein n=1 Tax=Cylindrospermum sp. FACHB-282 TaxID=2692794 RepID=UPI001684DCF5|nr:hypothetical protein [Cylindrospermum sp. FACHB-282]MBD2386159.1 hypothetical protein [Cylindrospermum sp. FACHB-282]
MTGTLYWGLFTGNWGLGKTLTHYPLPITHYPLPITNYPLPITHYPLPITHYQLPITNYPLPKIKNAPEFSLGLNQGASTISIYWAMGVNPERY